MSEWKKRRYYAIADHDNPVTYWFEDPLEPGYRPNSSREGFPRKRKRWMERLSMQKGYHLFDRMGTNSRSLVTVVYDGRLSGLGARIEVTR